MATGSWRDSLHPGPQSHSHERKGAEQKGAELTLFKAPPSHHSSPCLLVTQDTQAPYLSKSLCMAFFRHFAVNSIYPKPNSRFPLKLVPCQPLHICKPEIRSIMNSSGSPGGASGRELGCQCRRRKRLQSLGWEDPLKEGMATHCSILAWRIHGQESLAGYSPWGCKESDTTEATEHSHMNSPPPCPLY